jgi:hypothetical protein
MPNGHYPVPGLAVVLINRTEQHYPRIDWQQSFRTLNAAEFSAANGFVPEGPPNLGAPVDGTEFERLVEGVRRFLTRPKPDYYAGPLSASVVHVDFEAKEGWAAGRFFAYGFKQAQVAVLHDHTLGRFAPEADALARDLALTGVDTSGLVTMEPLKTPDWRFEFGDMDTVAVSNSPLHLGADWPPSAPLDMVAMALASRKQRDTWLALWHDPA